MDHEAIDGTNIGKLLDDVIRHLRSDSQDRRQIDEELNALVRTFVDGLREPSDSTE